MYHLWKEIWGESDVFVRLINELELEIFPAMPKVYPCRYANRGGALQQLDNLEPDNKIIVQ